MIYVKRLKDFNELSALGITSLVTGPFQSVWYQKVFSKHFSRESDLFLLGVYEDENVVGYGCFEKVGQSILFLGMKKILTQEEVSDYGDIFIERSRLHLTGEIWRKILNWLSENNFRQVNLDYLREDSDSFSFFKASKMKYLPQAVAPNIILPKTWEEYLDSLDRVDRKELKRKMRRLETISSSHVCSNQVNQEDFEELVRLVGISGEDKKQFMSHEMKGFFWDLITVEKSGWEADVCFLKIEGKNAAGILTFENHEQIFAYNSGFDSSYNYYSAGLMLQAHKIRGAIEKGKRVYDFMRGTERYKYDLGGKNLQLFRVEISL